MKLLVVGASGFIGRNVIRVAAREGWNTAGVYWKSADFERFASQYGCTAVRHNLLSGSRRWSADVCLYLAGNANHLASVSHPLRDWRLNVEALNRFLHGYKGGIVYMSSAAVYEGSRGLVSPQTIPNPEMPYAISKLASERYLFHNLHSGHLEWATVLRLYYAFGPHERNTRLIPRLVRASQSRDRTFLITASKAARVDPLYVEDVATSALAAAKGYGKNQILDLCGGTPRSVSAIVREVMRERNWNPRLIVKPRSGESPLRFFSDPAPARRELHLARPVSFRVGLERYLRWKGYGE